MANYPTTLPSTTPATHGEVDDEIVAIATELGTDPALAFTDVKARLAALVEPNTFAVAGTLADAAGKSRLYVEGACEVVSIRASVNTAPAGGTEIVDVNKNGTTLFTTQTNRPTIAAAGFTATGTPDVTTLVAGDYLTVDVDADGTATTRAADLTVTVRLRRTG